MNLTKRTIALGALIGMISVGLVACGGDDDGGGTAGAGGSATAGTGGATGGTGGATGGTGGATGGQGGTAQGGEGGTAQGGEGGTAQGGEGGTAQGGQGGSAQGGAGGSSQEGTDCAHAIDFVKNVDSNGAVAGVIDPAGDADYYKIDLKADKFYIFSTEANPDDDPAKVDTVISVLSADGTQRIATMDDSYPRLSTDSQLLYHSDKDQTVCIKIEDWSTWAGDTPRGDKNFVYKFSIGEPDENAEINNIDTEGNDDIANAQAATFYSPSQSKATYGQFYGTFKDGSDVDVYKFTPTADAVSVSIDFTPVGPGDTGKDKAKNGNGSTEQIGEIKITLNDGSIIGLLDVSKGSTSMNIPLDGLGSQPELFVHVPRHGDTAGANDFYTMFQANGDIDNPGETDETANNDLNTADALTMNVDPNDAKLQSGFILGHSPANDVDYFKFSAKKDDVIAMACGAARSGSGLRWATFAIVKSDGTEMQSETETDTADVYWTDSQYGSPSKPAVKITADGDYYLKVTNSGQDQNITSDFYRCGVHITSK